MKWTIAKSLQLFLVFTSIRLAQCTPEKKVERNIVQEIQQTGTLVTAEYTLQKLIRASDNKTWYKFGDRKILLSAEAVVKAGVELQHVKKENVWVSDSTIRLRLPPAKIVSVSLPPGKIKVQYEDVGSLRSRFSPSEREALLQQAEAQIRHLADSLGILETAKANATTFLRHLLEQAEFRQVEVEFEK